MPQLNRALRTTFGTVSELYDKMRLNYSDEVIQKIIDISGIQWNGKILEVGCGSGKATLPFTERGYDVTALDISENLIAIAKQKTAQYPNVKYLTTSFEEAALPKNHFDLLVSATAFHWVDPEIGYKKAARVLKPGGCMALFWNYTSYDETKLLRGTKNLYNKYNTDFPLDFGSTTEFEKRIEETGSFEEIKKIAWTGNAKYQKQDYVKLLNTFGWINGLDEIPKKQFFKDLEKLLESENELLEIPYTTPLLITNKKSTT